VTHIERAHLGCLRLDELPNDLQADAVRIIRDNLSTRARDHLAPTLAGRTEGQAIDVAATIDLIQDLVDLVDGPMATPGDGS
jgi:hypothetical protein